MHAEQLVSIEIGLLNNKLIISTVFKSRKKSKSVKRTKEWKLYVITFKDHDEFLIKFNLRIQLVILDMGTREIEITK